MGRTGIEWTDETWNPIRGCTRVSEGCRHCYAEQQAARIVRMGDGKPTPYDGLVKLVGPDKEPRWTGVVSFVPDVLSVPLRRKKPTRYFVNSMSDLFHESLSNEQIAAVFGVMAACHQHTFQILTKRARRMREWFEWVEREAAKAGPGAEVMLCVDCADEHDVLGERFVISPPWPLPNVWLGVSVENQAAADERIPELLRTPAAVRFLSCEPLLGPVNLAAWLPGEDECQSCGATSPAVDGDACPACGEIDHLVRVVDGEAAERVGSLHWVIAGCESGPGARPADSSWYRALRDQCAEAGVAFFLKQATEEGTWAGDNEHEQTVLCGPGSHRKPGGVIGAPYLDGVQHLAFPAAKP